MSIADDTRRQDEENYRNYRITKQLKGKMTPNREAVIRRINSRRKGKVMRTERFDTIVAFAILTLLVIMAGLGNHFIDGLGV